MSSDTIQIRDRRSGFLWIQNSFFDEYIKRLQPSSLIVYLALARLANNDTQCCYPSYQTLSEMTGLARSTVALSLEELKSAGIIDWEMTEGQRNVYSLLDTTSPKFGLVDQSDGSDYTSPMGRTGTSPMGRTLTRLSNKTHKQDSLSAGVISCAEEVFAVYPRKVAKRAAIYEIVKAIGRVQEGEYGNERRSETEAVEFIRERVELFARSPAGNRGRYTPHPATFFNGSRYLDDPKSWSQESGNGAHITDNAEPTKGQRFVRANQQAILTGFGISTKTG